MFLVVAITIILASIVHGSTAVTLYQLQDNSAQSSTANIDQPRSSFLHSRLSGFKESPSSEYVFWILFFGIIQRELPHSYGRVGFNFANEVYKGATNDQDNNIMNVFLYDRIFGFNGTSKNINWKNINLNFTDYGVALDSVVNMFEEVVTLGRVSTQEIQALAEIGQSVVNFWSRVNSDTMGFHEQSKWQIIVAGLTKLIGRGTDYTSPNRIILYEKSVHQGEFYTVAQLSRSQCFNIPRFFWDNTDSINTNNQCVIVYNYGDCQGHYRVFTPGTPFHYDFIPLGFSKEARSMALC